MLTTAGLINYYVPIAVYTYIFLSAVYSCVIDFSLVEQTVLKFTSYSRP